MKTTSTCTLTLRVLTTSIAAIITVQNATAQLTLTGTNYLQEFDSLSTGLPTGWTVRTGATATSLGTAQLTNPTIMTWGDSTGAFRNVASASNLTSGASTTVQGNATDRALGIRQTGSFGDPGAVFALEIANTVGFSDLVFTLDLEMLSVQGRSTTWSVQYGIGATPATFTTLHTFADPGAFGITASPTLTLGADANDLNDSVWIRVVALATSTGASSRDTFAIDHFALTWGSSVSTLHWDVNGATAGLGGTGVWDDATANWNAAATGDGAPGVFAAANPVVFGGTAGTVSVAVAGVSVNGGVQFDAPGYVIDGGTLTIGAAKPINTNHPAGTFTTINSAVAGSSGLSKTGEGTLVLSGVNTFTGNVSIQAGAVEIGSDTAFGDAANDVTFAGGGVVVTGDVNVGENRTLTGLGDFHIDAGKTLIIDGEANFASLVLRGAGTMELTGAVQSVGTITFEEGGTLVSAGTITANGVNYTQPASTATVAANLDLGSATRTFFVADGAENVDLSISGSIKLTGGTNNRLHKLGSGTLRLEGDNSGLNGLEGSIRIGTAGGTPAAGGTVVITSNKALGGNEDDTLQLQFNDGILQATQDMTGANAIALGVSLGAGQGAPATFAGEDMEFTGPVNVFKANGTYGHKLEVLNTTIFSGEFNISANAGTSTGLTITGDGTLVIDGETNSNDVPFIVDGPMLIVNGALTDALATMTVISGTLSGSGSIAADTEIQNGGALSPGASAGTLSFGGDLDIGGALENEAGGMLHFQLGDTSDVVLLTGAGTLNIGINVLEFDDFVFSEGAGFGPGTYTLFSSVVPIDGSLGTLLTGPVGEFTGNISFDGGNSAIVLTVVPEPGAATLVLCGLAMIARRRRPQTFPAF